MKYKCLIFDLDGTLLDSLQGILNAINKSFKELGFNCSCTTEQGKRFIGAGAIEFASRAMKCQNIPSTRQREVLESFFVNYSATQKTDTRPFDGISDMLKRLEKKGYLLTIASNKPQIMLEPIVAQCFPDIHFKMALGQRINKPEKPDPFIIFEIMNGLNVEPKDCLYIGDSEYDWKTAHNAGIDCAICRYGYGYYDQEFTRKTTYLVDTVEELEKLLEK